MNRAARKRIQNRPERRRRNRSGAPGDRCPFVLSEAARRRRIDGRHKTGIVPARVPVSAATAAVRSRTMRIGSARPPGFMTQSSRRQLDIDIPTQPEALVRCRCCWPRTRSTCTRCRALIESDMALAAAVLKAVNSSLYGLSGRVQSVQQAITYLGTREVAAVTFEIGLRAVFPPTPELEPVWQRAAQARPADGPHRPRAAASMPGPRIRPACSRSAARRCCSATRPTTTGRCCARRTNDVELVNSSTPPSASATTPWAPRCAKLGPGPRRGRQRAPPRGVNSDARAAGQRSAVRSGAVGAGPSLMSDPRHARRACGAQSRRRPTLDTQLLLRAARRVQDQLRRHGPRARRAAKTDCPSGGGPVPRTPTQGPGAGPGKPRATGRGDGYAARAAKPQRLESANQGPPSVTQVSPDTLALQRLYHWERTSPDHVVLTQPMGGGAVRDFTWSR